MNRGSSPRATSTRWASSASIAAIAIPRNAPPSSSPPPNIPDTAKSAYTLSEIKQWLRVFLYRFFELSQFKRSALPNGPKISSGGSLSPRGDWRAPSDATATVWLDELAAGVPDGE